MLIRSFFSSSLEFLYLVVMVVCATPLMIFIWLSKSELWYFDAPECLGCSNKIYSLIVYFIIMVGMAWLSIFITIWTRPDNSHPNVVKDVSKSNGLYFMSSLGYLFVGISVPSVNNIGCPDWTSMMIVYIIVVILIALSKLYYYNPIYLLFGYRFYDVVTENGIVIHVITRQRIYKDSDDVRFPHLKEITDEVFVEKRN